VREQPRQAKIHRRAGVLREFIPACACEGECVFGSLLSLFIPVALKCSHISAVQILSRLLSARFFIYELRESSAQRGYLIIGSLCLLFLLRLIVEKNQAKTIFLLAVVAEYVKINSEISNLLLLKLSNSMIISFTW
jgi:hypothetical protein